MKIKKGIGIIFIAILIIILLRLTIYAYFTNNFKTGENFDFGYSKIELIDNYDPPSKIEKGCNIPKEISVKNIGNVACYVRIKILFSDSQIENDLEIDFNKNNYLYNAEDGYWYCKKILNKEETTDKLFTNIKVKENAKDITLNKFKIYTYVETVQATENQDLNTAWNLTISDSNYTPNSDFSETEKLGNGKIKINKRISKNIITNDYEPTFFFKLVGKDDSGIIKATYIESINYKEIDYIDSQEEYITKSIEVSDLPFYNYEIIELPTYRYESNKLIDIKNSEISGKIAKLSLSKDNNESEITFETKKLKNINLLSTSKYNEITIQATEVEDIDIVPIEVAFEKGIEVKTSNFKYNVKYTDGRIQEKNLSDCSKINDSNKYIENQIGEHKLKVKVNYQGKEIEKEVNIYVIPNDYYNIEESESGKLIITGLNKKYEISQNLYILSTYNNKEVEEISDLAFENMNFQNIVIYEGIKKIGNYCFNNSNIENITLPNSLEKIGVGAFESEKITNITYSGTENDFSKINILEKNEIFKNIKINYKN